MPSTAHRHWGSRITAAGLLCGLLLCLPAAGQPRNVLVLYTNGRLLPANVDFDRGMSAVFAAHQQARVDLSAEFLDAPKFSGPAFDRTMADYLAGKYASRPPEVIVVAGEVALDFVLAHRDQMFPGIPVVYEGVASGHLPKIAPLPPEVIGTAWRYDFPGTVKLIERSRPQARRVVVVTGTGPWDRDWEAQVRADAKTLDTPLAIEFLAGLPWAELKQRLGELPSDAVVFTPGYFRDGAGHLLVPRESAQLIAGTSAVPVYGPLPTFIGTGIVGGSMASYATMGRFGGEAVLALLAGKPPADVRPAPVLPNQVHVDWRQVRRWDIAPESIPADAVVAFKEPTFWESYGHYVLIAGAVILVQSGLIAALLFERRRRRRTASALAQSEQRMSLAAHAAGLSSWRWALGGAGSADTGVRMPARRSTDRQPASSTDFEQVLTQIHPQDRTAVQQAVGAALQSGDELDIEYRVAAADGQTRWMAARGRADGGHGRHLLGVALDITPRKRAEAQAEEDRAALRHMTRVSLLGQLSASIAHQLNQPLASILSNAEAAQKMLQREPLDLGEMRDICGDIVDADHRAAEVIRRLGALFKRGEPKLARLDLNELVRDTLDLVRTNLLTRHIALHVELAPDLPRVDGDRVQLQQLLLNLIVNGADAMDGVAQDERRLTLHTEAADGGVLICVGDCGPGLPEADLAHVFEPFWSTKEGGMGMGLAICRSIAEAHHGRLSARNAPDGGAMFCVELPSVPEP